MCHGNIEAGMCVSQPPWLHRLAGAFPIEEDEFFPKSCPVAQSYLVIALPNRALAVCSSGPEPGHASVLDEAAQKHASPCLHCPPVSKLAVACLLSVECFLPLLRTGMKGVHTHHLALALQVWVHDVLEAQQVLDCETGQRYCKLQVRIPATAWFCMSARAFG